MTSAERQPETKRRRPGPRPRLDLPSIVRAAMEIADSEGLAAVSMANVAKRLGFTTMALYRHVVDKDDLVAEMLDAAVGVPDPLTTRQWRDGLAEWTTRILRRCLERPWVVEVPTMAAPTRPNALRWLEQALAVTEETPLPVDERLGVALVLYHFARSHAAMVIGMRRGATADHDRQTPSYAAALTSLVNAHDHPVLTRAIHSGELDVPVRLSPEEEMTDFRFGLDLILDGVATLIARHDCARRD